jgi:hypothetical protein
MADPVLVACPEDAWTLVASNVTSGQIWNKKTDARYYQTYRDTGQPAPTDLTDAVNAFDGTENNEIISAAAGIDVYLYCEGDDGLVRVDL